MFGEVTSANIVGYNGTALKSETYYMVAVHFDEVVGSGAGLAIKDLITGNIPYGTELQLLRPAGGYDIYKYLEEAYDEGSDEFIPGWGDVLDNIATRKVAPGSVFWLKAPADANVTIAGAVLADASKSITFVAKEYSMLGNPYPVAVNPNAITWEGLSYGDELQILKSSGSGYDIYKYLEEAYDEGTDDFIPGWGDVLDNIVTTGIIPVGQGAWIKPATDTTATFASPL